MPKIYTQAFKEDVVKYYERNHTVAETLSEYGISESSLFAWKKQYDQAHQLCIFAPSQRKNLRHSQARLKKTGEMLEVLDRCSCGIYASIDEKMEAIAQLEGQYSVHVLCEALKLPRGTYYNRKRNHRSTGVQKLEPIQKVFPPHYPPDSRPVVAECFGLIQKH